MNGGATRTWYLASLASACCKRKALQGCQSACGFHNSNQRGTADEETDGNRHGSSWAAPAVAGDFYAGTDISRDKIDGSSESVNGIRVTMAD